MFANSRPCHEAVVGTTPAVPEDRAQCYAGLGTTIAYRYYEVSTLSFHSIHSLTISSALYHTFRILLFRPMLSWQVYPEEDGPHPMQNHLVECVTSATAIIAIFDLFCRTFTISHCVLSLSYSVYIAATIFLLQVQATPEDQQAVRKLNFCVRALQQAKTVNPGE